MAPGKAAPPNGDDHIDPDIQAPAAAMAQAMAIAQGNVDKEDEEKPTKGSNPLAPGIDHPEELHDKPAPAFGDDLHQVKKTDHHLGVEHQAVIADDGRVNINIHQHSRRLSTVLGPALEKCIQRDLKNEEPLPAPYIPPSLGGEPGVLPPPRMAIVIHVVGSRGDVQPFVALGKVLQDVYGHRVRLATHLVFQDLVIDNGLEFFNIGGDPAELMAFMVKNPGLMPGFDTLRSGDVGKRRKEIATMIKGCWRSCIESGNGTGLEVNDETFEDWMHYERIKTAAMDPHPLDRHHAPFVADVIIANPPSFAHIHCAEKLGIPLHIMFTMPYSPTQAFPHPLTNIQSSNAEESVTNLLSYGLVDTLTWQGLGDIVNRFRVHTLGLEPISLIWAPNMLARLRIPHTYCWSPALIPKPKDWGNHISISGFYFLSVANSYTPEPKLAEFLAAGPPPVYIGFGSIVVDGPNAMTKMVFDAVRMTGQRALVSKGWGGMGADELGIPEGVMMLGNVPHDWLFKHVSCVVHHGGAGTTAAGIAAGRPTVVVPFFGDQPFWGAMVAKAGAGPFPIPYKELTAEKLAEQIKFALKPGSLDRAKELSETIAKEDGGQTGAQLFHQHLKLDDLRCSLAPHRKAVWRIKRTQVKLSALAATVLGNEGYIDFKDLKLYRPVEYETDSGPIDPITGATSALVGTASAMLMGIADFPVDVLKALKIHPDSVKKRKEAREKSIHEGSISNDSHSSLNSPRSSVEALSTTRTSISTPSKEGTLVEPPTPEKADAHGGRESLGWMGPDPFFPKETETSNTHSSDQTPIHTPSSSQFNLHESIAKISTNDSTQSDSKQSIDEGRGRHGSAMRMALRDQLSDDFIDRAGIARDSSRQRSSSRHSFRRKRSQSPAPTQKTAADHIDTAIETSTGIAKMIDAGIRAPMEFTNALARGFHNAPKLYGDDSVRQVDHISGMKSGFKAAGKEFGFGLYDGITGLVTQPYHGAKKEGAAGFFKGIGKGIGGVILKPSAAGLGLAGYSMKGVFQELQTHFGNPVQNYMIAARTTHGIWGWHHSTAEERDSIVERWLVLEARMKKKKDTECVIAEWRHKTGERIEARRAQRKEKINNFLSKTDFGELIRRHTHHSGASPGHKHEKSAFISTHEVTSPTKEKGGLNSRSSSWKAKDSPGPASSHPLRASTFSAPLHEHPTWSTHFHDEAASLPPPGEVRGELENAIHAAIAAHSTGDPAHDAMIERSIRIALAHYDARPMPLHAPDDEHTGSSPHPTSPGEQEPFDREGIETAITRSLNGGAVGVTAAERELAAALAASLEDADRRNREEREERIVFQYVKDQSKREEELRVRKEAEKGIMAVGVDEKGETVVPAVHAA